MKIKDYRSVKTICFRNLEPGEIFCYVDTPGVIYMKLSNFNPNNRANIVDIDCGKLDYCSADLEVIPLSAEVIIRYDEEN